jgi:hypothetical protein
MYWWFKKYYWKLSPSLFDRIRLLTNLINLHNGWRLQQHLEKWLMRPFQRKKLANHEEEK